MNLKRTESRRGAAAAKGWRRNKLIRRLLKTLRLLLMVFILIGIGGYFFMHQRQFGKEPAGERLERIQNSPNYIDGKFQNPPQPADTNPAEDFNLYGVLKEFLFNKSNRRAPSADLPSVKTDLKSLKPDENVMVWFGHSSYFLQVDGKKILIDPMLSGCASPVKFSTRSYKGSDIYTTEDIPDIDYLFISHDHFDHLDYDTVTKLKSRIKKVVTGLGVGAHFEYWGFDKSSIIEKDWNETAVLDDGFEVTVTAARHGSGRGLKANQTLWASFVLKTPSMKIFYSGDSGYGTHFKNIGSTYGPFDLALLECGQYGKYWKNKHMIPEEVVQAALDLNARKLMPGHWSKFSLSLHDWDEPIIRVIAESKRKDVPLLYPMIGEKVDIREAVSSDAWWEKVVPKNDR